MDIRPENCETYVRMQEVQLRNAKRSYTCAKHSSLQTVDGATGVVGGGHTMHKEIKKKESKKEKGEEFWKDHFVHLDDHNKML